MINDRLALIDSFPPPLTASLTVANDRPCRNPVIAVLDIEYNELAQAWRRLQAFLPLESQVEFQERPQDARALLAEIHNIQAAWMSSPRQRMFSRSMSLCDDFISTVDAHSFLWTALPESQSYLALFYGTVQAAIKVRIYPPSFCLWEY